MSASFCEGPAAVPVAPMNGAPGEAIKVAIRVRKLLNREAGQNINWKCHGENTITTMDGNKRYGMFYISVI